MANFLMVALMLSLAVFYSADQSTLSGVTTQSRSTAQAAAMASYRTLVVDYYSAHPDKTTFAPPSPSSPLLVAAGDWGNYHAAGSPTVIVYAKSAQAPELLPAVLALSQNSWMVGTSEGGYFKSALSSVASNMPLPLPAIASGNPVWISSINASY
jgi:hypothetical protein